MPYFFGLTARLFLIPKRGERQFKALLMQKRMGCPAVSVNVIYGWIVCWICNFNYCGLHVNNCCIFRVRLIEILHRYVII